MTPFQHALSGFMSGLAKMAEIKLRNKAREFSEKACLFEDMARKLDAISEQASHPERRAPAPN